MKKLVVIGANEFQLPLIMKAKEMGYETHVFAWEEGAVGKEAADYFYPISITETEEILKVCRQIQPDGVASIGSDLANITVAKLAGALGLPGNDLSCIEKTTNKEIMREALRDAGVPVPFFRKTDLSGIEEKESLPYPLIVKPTDRSGSRAITRVEEPEELDQAIRQAIEQSFEKKAIVESYIEGREYSMESISYQGKHTCLAITKKFTTGAPHYIETGHMQPAPLEKELEEECIRQIQKALDALEIQNGASHAEFRIDRQGNVRIIEIGSRMGGDCIGSHLVPLSTGHDFVKMVIQTAVGEKPELKSQALGKVSAIRFICREQDRKQLEYVRKRYPHAVRLVQEPEHIGEHPVTSSGSRFGFYILQTDTPEEMREIYYSRPFEREIPVWKTPIQKLYGWEDSQNTIYMKREDLLGFSFGGNKVRFAEKFLRDMEQGHYDSMVIYGNYHSNLCRILSVACKREGIPCYMIYNQDDIKEEKEDCNKRLICRMDVIPVPCGRSTIADAVAEAMERLREQGHNPYYIYGNIYGEGNETVPMEAYVEVYREILKQQEEQNISFDYVFLASSTNTTQSGLLTGRFLCEQGPRVAGISVSRNRNRGREVIAKNVKCCMEKEQKSLPENWEEEIIFEDSWLSGGYGNYGDEIEQIMEKMYLENGIGLDAAYTAKGFWGMLEYLKREGIQGKNILFLHTGGTPLFFDHMIPGAKGHV